MPWFLTHPSPQQIYLEGSYLVVDLETDNLDKGSALTEDNDIVLACWTVVNNGEVVKQASNFGGIYEQQELLDDIGAVNFIVAHNAKFELQWLRRCGLDLRSVLCYDTMLAEWVLDGNKRDKRSLDALAAKYGVAGKLDSVSQLIKNGVNTRDINPRWLRQYCQDDVEACHQIFIRQKIALSVSKQWHLIHVRNLTCAVLADVEFEGLCLDPTRVTAEYIKATSAKQELGGRLATITGGINLNSPKQLSTFLYGTLGLKEAKDYKGNAVKTSTGEASSSNTALAALKPETEEQRSFLETYREYNKQVSLLEKNLDYFKLTCEQKGSKFFGLLKQNATQTHRLASSGLPILFKGLKKSKAVQLQNIPREYKKLFWSGEEDWLIAEYDSAQVEFRVAVDMGKDKVGLKEVEAGTDVHSFTAKVLFENGDPEMAGLNPKARRQEAKKSTFRPLYGGSSGSPAIIAYCEYFKDKYKGISKTQRTWALQCLDKKQFTTPYGMTFFFPNTKMTSRGYINNTTSIYNYPVQGFATGEIIPIALVYFWHRTKGMRVKICTTVHDSIIVKIHKDEADSGVEIAKQSLTTDVYEFLERVYHYTFKVPLGLGYKIATHWSDTDIEKKWDRWPDGREEGR